MDGQPLGGDEPTIAWLFLSPGPYWRLPYNSNAMMVEIQPLRCGMDIRWIAMMNSLADNLPESNRILERQRRWT